MCIRDSLEEVLVDFGKAGGNAAQGTGKGIPGLLQPLFKFVKQPHAAPPLKRLHSFGLQGTIPAVFLQIHPPVRGDFDPLRLQQEALFVQGAKGPLRR